MIMNIQARPLMIMNIRTILHMITQMVLQKNINPKIMVIIPMMIMIILMNVKRCAPIMVIFIVIIMVGMMIMIV